MPTPSARPSVSRSLAPSVYFPNLNGVRFIACTAVLIHHIEQVKYSFQLPNSYDFYLVRNMGKLGVGLFFVLSGFLITYLLLNEKDQHRDIDIRRFYARRALRIWPLYYLIVLLSCFVFPAIPLFREAGYERYYFDADFYRRLGLFSVVLPNIAMIVYGSPYLCAQTWSVGVEEQFYLLWPWIIKKGNTARGLLLTLAIFVGVLVGVLYGLVALVGQESPTGIQSVHQILVFFFGQFRILTMVIGGGGAYLVYYRKESVLRIMFRPVVQRIVYAILLIMLLTNVTIPGINLEFYALFFGFFIINLAANPRSIVRLEQPLINYLGKISYGIYIYHTAIIVLTVNAMRMYVGPDLRPLPFSVLLYGGSVLGTVLVAGLSYQYIEKPFLRLKKRFGHSEKVAVASAPGLPAATLS